MYGSLPHEGVHVKRPANSMLRTPQRVKWPGRQPSVKAGTGPATTFEYLHTEIASLRSQGQEMVVIASPDGVGTWRSRPARLPRFARNDKNRDTSIFPGARELE